MLVGHGENSIFEIHNELRARGGISESANQRIEPNQATITHPRITSITPIIADIRFADRIRAVFEAYRPEIVFHAGAHKHVPLMESNEVEAVTNNVLGTRNVVEAAVATGAERFLMISTDKAVNPTSVMGASNAWRRWWSRTRGGSRGAGEPGSRGHPRSSAPPPLCPLAPLHGGAVRQRVGQPGQRRAVFQRQIAAGGPVTVTHPDMRRYFMTIPEAVQLVLQAAVMGKGGEVFALDMGEPVRIVDLAHDLIRLSGLEHGARH